MIVEHLAPAELKPHPRNYRSHPPAQVEHLKASITEHGLYRNIIIAREGTVLAGHGVLKAALSLEMSKVPVVRMDLDPDEPQALKILAGDNEIGDLATDDEALLADILKSVQGSDLALLGTGFDDIKLAELIFLTETLAAPPVEDRSQHWAGMPEFQQGDLEPLFKAVISFRTMEDVAAFEKLVGQAIPRNTKSIWYPQAKRVDAAHLAYLQTAE